MTANSSQKSGVIVLGDRDTGQRAKLLSNTAAEHDTKIIDFYTFDAGEAASQDDLEDVEAVVMALSRAIHTRSDIWVPFPKEDLGREQHQRRLCLVLQRRGLNLVVGQHLWPCPADGGMNEADYALRREVQAVDALDRAALAAAGVVALDREIQVALTDAACTWEQQAGPLTDATVVALSPSQTVDDIDMGPALPPPSAPWPVRLPALKLYARWLVFECGLTQSEAAGEINATGHLTPQGRSWQQATVSALINGRYNPRLAS